MPYLHGQVQFVMPPFGSVGSGLASYRDMTNVLRDKKEIKYSPICDLKYMLTAENRNNYDKVMIVASNISSITCKQSNLVELLEDFRRS
ncbi:hypothetical protein DAPPUDRAFT_239508 [Daphnia pulex]|uniref:Uncharacterized protein n=1 Tax=Daphnia pulex TaxID=6669 RepID=E9G9I6_DAPPU|nr:hypothetical protein DAPPUDRAFT_239508 [Daphnia pulex]|eukprot:EFX83874.1 hypothetical protein DAPPUDRAFT_239508 [Daphnia pulex]